MPNANAIIGWSLPAIESAQKLGKPFVVVSFEDFAPYAQEHDIPFVSWDFRVVNDAHNSLHLAELLKPYEVNVAVPLFEETVEWAGALNSIYRDDPSVFNRSLLFRNKAMMKRKALLSGLRVGLFDEVYDRAGLRKFYERLQEAQIHRPGVDELWVHIKPFDAMGAVGHRLLRSEEDIETKTKDTDFPCLAESHLPGREFSCEAFVHDGKMRFLNVTEYIRLGHTNFVPASERLEEKRPLIEKAMNTLIEGFGIQYGMLHPEWFLTEKDEISFGEVACRIPGGQIFELIEKSYGFDPIQALYLCSNPATTEDELESFFPKEAPKVYSGCTMIYPSPGEITRLEIPDELEEDPDFWKHTLVPPARHKVGAEREGFGNHYGCVYFHNDNPERMRELLVHYDGVDFYV